jgi:hypothetical protein
MKQGDALLGRYYQERKRLIAKYLEIFSARECPIGLNNISQLDTLLGKGRGGGGNVPCVQPGICYPGLDLTRGWGDMGYLLSCIILWQLSDSYLGIPTSVRYLGKLPRYLRHLSLDSFVSGSGCNSSMPHLHYPPLIYTITPTSDIVCRYCTIQYLPTSIPRYPGTYLPTYPTYLPTHPRSQPPLSNREQI